MTKPGYSTFWNDYSTQIANAASGTNVPQSAIASQWYQEWGIPINNPGNQLATEGQCTNGSSGGFPIFCTLDDGVQAYIDEVNAGYNGHGDVPDIFGNLPNWAAAFTDGFPGGKTASNVQTDTYDKNTGTYVKIPKATSVQYYGLGNTPNPPSAGQLTYYNEQGALAVCEAMGASPWDSGHYLTSSDTMPGQTLVNIEYDSGWLSAHLGT